MTGRTQRLRRGILASLLSQVVGTVDQLLLVPLFLACWGPQLYGEWLALFAAVAYVTLADLGFSSYVVNRLAQQNARGERESYLATLHSAFAFTSTVAVAAFGLLALGALSLPFQEWLRMEAVESAVAVACLLALQVTLSIPRGLVLGIYRSIGEYDRGTMLENARRLTAVAVTCGLLFAGSGPLGIAIGQLAPLVLVLGLACRDTRRRHPWIVLGVSARVPGLARSFVGPSAWFLGVQLSLVLLLQGTTVAAGVLFGAGVVATFVSTRTLTNLVRQFTGAVSNALWPEITALAARGDARVLDGVHLTFVKGVTACALAAATFLALAGPDLFQFWTRGALVADHALMLDFLLLLLVQTPWTASSYVLLATNSHAGLARRQLGAAAGSLLGGIALAVFVGPRGLVWGILLVETALCALQVPRAALKITGGSLREYGVEVYLRGLAVVGVVIGATHLVTLPEALGPAPRISLQASLAAASVGAASWWLWLRADERSRVTRLVGLGLRFRSLRAEGRET